MNLASDHPTSSADEPLVDIVLCVYNGLPYVEELIQSIKEQSWTNWRLWVRDDGSTDGTLEALKRQSGQDPRILVVEDESTRLGARAGFSRVLELAAPDADYIMFCDADDIWLPRKIESSLEALRKAEQEDSASSGVRPVLVHTNLVVVDSDLQVISGSFWEYERIRPSSSLRQLLIQNTVTGCTIMMNGALRRLVAPISPNAVMHDWWFALVAACFGTIVSLPEPHILYRQHGRNDTGARKHPGGVLPRLQRLVDSAGSDGLRTALRASAVQAAGLLEQFGPDLTSEQRELIAAFSEIPQRGALSRKLRLIQLGTLTCGWDRRLNLILRA